MTQRLKRHAALAVATLVAMAAWSYWLRQDVTRQGGAGEVATVAVVGSTGGGSAGDGAAVAGPALVSGVPRPWPQVVRGQNERRVFGAPRMVSLDAGLRDARPATLAVAPADGRLELLPEESEAHTLRARRMVMDPVALERVIGGQTARLLVPTADGETLDLTLQQVKTRSESTHTLIGNVTGEEGDSDALLVYHDGIIHGSVARYPSNQHLEYRILADGHLMVREIDSSTMDAPCAHPGDCDGNHDHGADGDLLHQGETSGALPGEGAGDGSGELLANTVAVTTIDIVIGYDRGARIADGGFSQIEARILASVDRMNQAFVNSEIHGVELMLLGTIEDPDYVFPGAVKGTMGASDEVAALNSSYDGVLDAVSDYARELGADLRTFVIKDVDGGSGIAYTPGTSSVIARTYMTSNRLVLTHELGHSLGCDHSWGDTSQAYHPRYGWRFTGSNGVKYRTVMAYDWNWGAILPRFSNPNLTVSGSRTGAVNGYNARNDGQSDQRYVTGGMGYTGYDRLKAGFDGTVAALGANNAGMILNGGSSFSHGATYASRRSTRKPLQIVEPLAGSFWGSGVAVPVYFLGGDMNDRVTIELRKGGQLVATIASGINPLDRALTWQVPAGLTTGGDYCVRLTLTQPDGAISQVDSGHFTINNPTPEIVTTMPARGEEHADIGAALVATFDEPVIAGQGFVRIRNLTDGVEMILEVGDTRAIQVSGHTMTILSQASGLLADKVYAVWIDSGAVLDLDGNPFDGLLEDGVWTFETLHPFHGAYEVWAELHLGDGSLLSDTQGNHDGDAFTNLQEFAFGTHPADPFKMPIDYIHGGHVLQVGLPKVEIDPAGNEGVWKVFTRRKDHEQLGLTYRVEFSADLRNWVDADTSPVRFTAADAPGDVEVVGVRFPDSISVGATIVKPRFARIWVHANP